MAENEKNRKNEKQVFIGAVILLLLFIAAGIWSIQSLVRYERQRDLNTWQITLNVMADSRAAQLRQWAAAQFAKLTELAGNGSLQLYTQELLRRPETPGETEPAQLSYLRNLIRVTAARDGFADNSQTGPLVPANIAFEANAGLTLIGPRSVVITATRGMPALNNGLRKAAAEVLKSGRPRLYGLFKSEGGHVLVGFLTPVFALQMPSGGKQVIAVLVGLKNARESLFPLLASGSVVTRSDEALLVRRNGNLITYVSPLADGTPPLERRLAANSRDLTAAYMLAHPGGFTQMRDYAGVEVLATSRVLTGLPWLLIQKINADEALKESRSHQRFLQLTLLLALFLIAALLSAAWFYGSNERERRVSSRLTTQTHLLNAINNNINDYIFLIDFKGLLLFANRTLAQSLEVAAGDLDGKSLSNVFGPAAAKRFQPLLRTAREKGTSVISEIDLELHGRQLRFHAACIPIVYRGSSANDAILVSLHDITLLRDLQAKKARLMEQTVKALMRAIDIHDPYSANHSANTAKIALAIARSMELTEADRNVLETAANLCNIGKLFIPKELLAKTGPLSSAERAILRQETEFAGEILAGIDFEGPVLTTIIQKNEFLDGSGHPAGLKGEAIIPPARIIAAANAFVAMISPRAYREKMTVEEALDKFLQESGTRYDRRVVAALFHVAENEIDWSSWQGKDN
ncbi:HD domain-containing phosphohydrolase [Desulfobacterota bacterium M19]